MTVYLCNACGTSYPPSQQAPAECPICLDERQYVPESGQKWLTQAQLNAGHSNMWKQHENNLFEIITHPAFAIGQRAFLIRTPYGNILWDCIALLDEATTEIIHALGGISAIAISHPHYYTTMQDWAQAFDAPVYLHEWDRQWVMRQHENLHFWQGEQLEINNELTLIRVGGHFPGGTVLHWRQGADGRGALLSGDIVQVAPASQRVSFMWSYPNMLPLSAATVQRIGDTLASWEFDSIYGAFEGKTIKKDGKSAIKRSVTSYIALLKGEQR